MNSDYFISAIRYSAERNNKQKSVQYFKVHSYKDNEIASGNTWTRDEVIQALKEGKQFCTIFKNESDNWVRGTYIRLIDNEGHISLTNSNKKIECDNILNIREF